MIFPSLKSALAHSWQVLKQKKKKIKLERLVELRCRGFGLKGVPFSGLGYVNLWISQAEV